MDKCPLTAFVARLRKAVSNTAANLGIELIGTIYTQRMFTHFMVKRFWLVLGVLVVTSVSLAQQEVFEACAPAVSTVVLKGSPDPAT